jgi:secreted protein with Ig-like and vWFA domain/anti-sigma-K factor RskA
MSHAPITPDDPRLTAYVLGELDDADRAAVDAALAADPECRQAVEELRQTTAVLFEALQSEPVPALSDAQRTEIRRSAARPSPRRTVRVHEPATSGRRGILPLLAATIACAALLVGVSAWNFERPAQQTAALFDNPQSWNQLLALHDSVDGLATADESAYGELDQILRLGSLADTEQMEADIVKTLRELSRESEQLGQIIVATDGETPSVTMNIEQAETSGMRVIRLQDRSGALTGEQLQGLANTTTRPSVPGNMGGVVDPSVDFIQRSFPAGGQSVPSAGATSSLETLPATRYRESTSGVADGGQGSSSGAAGDVLRSKVHEFRRPTVQYEQQLGRQAGERSGQGEGQPATTHYYRVENRFGSPTPQHTRERFGTAAAPSPASPTPQPAAAGMAGQPAASYDNYGFVTPPGGGPAASPTEPSAESPSSFVTRSGARPPAAGGEGINYAPPSAQPSDDGTYFLFDKIVSAPAERREALRENLGGMPSQSSVRDTDGDGVGDGVWLDLDFSPLSLEDGRQFVPMFAVTDLRRLAEPASGQDGAGIAAGDPVIVNGVPPVMSNSVTVEQDLFLGAQPLVEGEQRGLQEKREAALGLAWGRTPVTWEDGSWYAVVRGGRKLRIKVPGTEAYAPIRENEFVSPGEQPLSTFGLDVDTASYANVRRFLMDERRFPPPDAVRIEELVNYFAYSDPQPAGGEPVGVSLEAAACPWNAEHRLVRIGVKAQQIDLAERPPTTLVFLIDTSGSMRDDNKLPLVKDSLRILVNEMTENDRIAIVTYNNDAGLLLDSTSGEHRREILAAIDGLQANGSTNGEAGLKLAYEIATKHFIESGQNRVILCTDGDFNVGTSATDPLVKMIANKRDTGVFLSICGYGTGNIKDEKLERIANTGNGLYHYVDNLKEARKVFLDELTGTLYTVAKDVKLQVEFNPARVASYRLIGYENRTMAAEDFNNDRVDSGDMGAGHSVTALYEVVPVGMEPAKPAGETPGVDPLKYQGSGGRGQESGDREQEAGGRRQRSGEESAELLTVKLRYKQPDGVESVKREFPLVDDAEGSASIDLQWSAAVASFGMLLRSSRHAGGSSLEGVLEMAQSAKGRDESGRRREFIDMVLQTRSLVRRLHGSPTPTPRELSSTEARQRATVEGKYEELLDKFEARDDAERYGEFHDYGWSADKSHAGRSGLPAGYWVYVYPDWYIWGETVSARE